MSIILAPFQPVTHSQTVIDLWAPVAKYLRAMEGDKPLDSTVEALETLTEETEEHLETDRPTVKYRLYKRRFAGLVALVSKGF